MLNGKKLDKPNNVFPSWRTVQGRIDRRDPFLYYVDMLTWKIMNKENVILQYDVTM